VKVSDLAREMPQIVEHYKQQTLINIKSKAISKSNRQDGKRQPAKKKQQQQQKNGQQ